MRPIKIVAPIIAFSVSAFALTGCGLFDSKEQKAFTATVPEIIREYDSIKWDLVENASEYQVYCNGSLVETVTDNVYKVADEIKTDSTYYIIAHSAELKRDTKQSNEVIYYKNADFSEGETLKVTSSSSVTVSNNIRQLEFDGYEGSVTLDIADRIADLTVSIKDSKLYSGLNFRVEEDKKPYTVILDVKGTVSISGKNGKSYTAADKGKNNSETDGKRGGNGETALRADTLVIKGDGNLYLNGGNGGNASEGSDSSGLLTTKYCGKGASGGNGGNGLTCDTLYLKMAEESKVTARAGTGGKKSSPGSNGAGISGPIVSAAWYNWDIGKDGSNGANASITKSVILSGELV